MVAFLLVFVALGRLYRQMLKRPESRALLLLALAVIIVGMVFYTNVEGWSWIDAFYFCVVTLGTVGYGDITPTTDIGKLFTSGYIIVGLGIIGGFFATAGQLLHVEQVVKQEKSIIEQDIHQIKERRKDESSDK